MLAKPPHPSPASGRGTTSQRLALPALTAGACFLGFSPIAVRLSELGPSATAFHRVLLALPLFWLVVRLGGAHTRALARADHAGMALAGVFFAADLALWHWSIHLTTVANATLFSNFAPIFVTIGAWAFLRERITAGFLAGGACALAGALLLMSGSAAVGARAISGDLLGLSTAVFYGAYLVAVKDLRERLPTSVVMLWSGVAMAVVLLVVALLSRESLWPATGRGWLVLFAVAWLSHATGQGLIAWALKHLPASFTSVTLLLQPLVAALLAWALFEEALGPLQAAGAALVLAGILWARSASLVAPPRDALKPPPPSPSP
jgi:drug/metabolite transporter (DMT)-like permease